jgi:hypothetical protein
MPCDMYRGATSGDFASNKADRLEIRIAELEQALCGLCQQLSTEYGPNLGRVLHPQLQAWFEKHRDKPGCTVP